MKKILMAVLMSAVVLISACSADEKTSSDSGTESVSYIENACKNIIIAGHSIEIPFKLGSLNDGWTYELMAEPTESGMTGADIYYNGEYLYSGNVNNCFMGNEDDGTVYYIAVENENGSIDGIIPSKTTKSDVLNQYGEPDLRQGEETFEAFWYRGTMLLEGEYIFIAFDGNLVRSISISVDVPPLDMNSIGG